MSSLPPVEETVLGAPPEAHEAPKEIAYAGFHLRMVASTMDCLLILFFLTPFFAWASMHIVGPLNEMQSILLLPPTYESLSQDERAFLLARMYAEFMDYADRVGLWGKAALNYGFQYGVVGLITVPLWVYKGATPGKMLLGIKVVDSETFGHIGFFRGAIRYLAYMAALLPAMIGVFWIGWNRRKRGWHDMLAGTVVIKNRESPFNLKNIVAWARRKLKRA